MDAVILAAGKGERLDGIAAPYHKPLLVVNGKPLIRQCVDHVLDFADKIIIVAAPENALPISQVLSSDLLYENVEIIIQRKPKGPGDALMKGLNLASARETLVLMGDNVIHKGDVSKIAKQLAINVVGVATVPPTEENNRFTRLSGDLWIEKTPFTTAEHGRDAIIWLGPIKVDTDEMYEALRSYKLPPDSNEIPIGHLFNNLHDVVTVPVEAFDIGVPEALV